MGSYIVTEKMTEIVQILAEHYDYAVSEDNTAMSAVHEKKKAAQRKYDAAGKGLDPEMKEIISDLVGAYDEENQLLSIYAFLHGLKCGMRLDEWSHTDDEPLFFEQIGKRDYMERMARRSAMKDSNEYRRVTAVSML